jgi:putative inorganic carbon (hco3(-)) transporter
MNVAAQTSLSDEAAPRSQPSTLARAATALIAAGVLLLPFARPLALPVAGSYVELSDALFALAGLAWLGSLIVGGERPRWRRAYMPLAGYVVLCVSSYLWAVNPRAWLVHAAAALYQAGLCVMIAHVLACDARRRVVVGAWLGAALITIALGLAGVLLFYAGVRERAHNPFLWNYGSVPVGDYPRLYVLFRNGNALCNYLLVSVGLALAFARVSPRVLSLGVAAASFVAVFTLSPGVGGLFLLLGLWLWWSERTARLRRAALALGVLAALGFFALSVVSVVPRGQGELRLGPIDVLLAGSPRISVWSSAAERFAQQPVLGQGLGAPSALITDPRVYTPRDQWTHAATTPALEPRASDAHNTALSLLSQLGVTGFALFAAFVVLVFVELRAAPPAIAHGLAAALSGGLLYHGLFGSFEEMRHLWLLFGLCLCAGAPGPQRYGRSAGLAPTGLPASS